MRVARNVAAIDKRGSEERRDDRREAAQRPRLDRDDRGSVRSAVQERPRAGGDAVLEERDARRERARHDGMSEMRRMRILNPQIGSLHGKPRHGIITRFHAAQFTNCNSRPCWCERVYFNRHLDS